MSRITKENKNKIVEYVKACMRSKMFRRTKYIGARFSCRKCYFNVNTVLTKAFREYFHIQLSCTLPVVINNIILEYMSCITITMFVIFSRQYMTIYMNFYYKNEQVYSIGLNDCDLEPTQSYQMNDYYSPCMPSDDYVVFEKYDTLSSILFNILRNVWCPKYS